MAVEFTYDRGTGATAHDARSVGSAASRCMCDKKLRQWAGAAAHGYVLEEMNNVRPICVVCKTVWPCVKTERKALAAALLRARETLDEIAWPLKQEAGCSGPITLPKSKEELFGLARTALTDTELEEVLTDG